MIEKTSGLRKKKNNNNKRFVRRNICSTKKKNRKSTRTETLNKAKIQHLTRLQPTKVKKLFTV